MAQAASHGRQDVTDIVVCAEVIKRDQPAVLAPDRGLVHADGHDVESAALGGDVGGDTLAKNVFFKCDPFNIVTGLGCEVVGETLHPDHVAIVDRCNGQCFCVSNARRHQRRRGCRADQFSEVHGIPPPELLCPQIQHQNIFSRQYIFDARKYSIVGSGLGRLLSRPMRA